MNRLASVDFPWSTWAMVEIFRMFFTRILYRNSGGHARETGGVRAPFFLDIPNDMMHDA